MGQKPGSEREFGEPGGYQVDWDQVRSLCAIQCSQDEIAAFLKVSKQTLWRRSHEHFGVPFNEVRKQWANGGKCSLRRKQWKLADTSATMAIFLGKQILGQRDDVNLNYAGQITQEIVHYGDSSPKTWKDEKEELE